MRSFLRIGSFCLGTHNAHYAKSSPEAAAPSACAGRTQPKSPHTLVVDSWEKYYLYSRIIRFPLSEISSFFIVISRILCTSSLSFDIPLIPFLQGRYLVLSFFYIELLAPISLNTLSLTLLTPIFIFVIYSIEI